MAATTQYKWLVIICVYHKYTPAVLVSSLEVVPLLFGTGDIERPLTYTPRELFPGKSSAKPSSVYMHLIVYLISDFRLILTRHFQTTMAITL